jgi:FkbM family methyltransferase
MDPVWLMRNIRTAWRRRAGATDFFGDLKWVYGRKLGLEGREFTIAFRYPAPIGKIRLRLRANRGADAFIQGEVFEHEYYRLPLATDPATILDLGANIGLTAIYFGRHFPQATIACVEPFSGNLRLLDQNLEMNRIRARVFPAAIDVEDGSVVMALDRNDYGHRISSAEAVAGEEKLAVAAISVPTLMAKMGWDRIGLLKADIEGHEKILFSRQCDWLGQVDAMCIEWHDEEAEARRQLTSLAQRFGFGPPQLLAGVWFMSRTKNP